MKHVDEGLLHAYLDDGFRPGEAMHTRIAAHLALCGECRARLEEARQLRDLAGVIVEDLGPRGAIAPAAELLPGIEVARFASAAPRPRRAVQRRGWLPVAWAASVLLALAGGWMVGERWQVVERVAGPAGGPEAEVGSNAPDAIPSAKSEVTTLHRPPVEVVTPSRHRAEAAPAAPAAAEVPQSSPPPLLLPEVAPRLAAGHDLRPGELPAPSVAIPPRVAAARVLTPSLSGEGELTPSTRAAEGRRGREAVAAERTVVGPLPDASGGTPRAAPPRGGPRPPLGRGAGGLRPAPPSTSPRASSPQPEAAWRPVLLPDAEGRLGEPLAFVEGLPITGVWVAREEAGWKARITQRLEGGGELELVQRGSGTGREEALAAPAPAAQAVRTGQATVLLRLRAGGPVVSLSAPLSQEALLELASRVRAGQP